MVNIKKIIYSNIFFAFCAIFFLGAFWFGADFGKFSPDYYAAHSIAMSHLHQNVDFFQLLRTIPNSASGVFPLWLFGFFEGYLTHKLLSLIVFLTIIGSILYVTRLNKYGRFFIMALLLSPMMISSTAWVLPEIFSLLSVVVVCILTVNHPAIAIVIASLVPLSRQTFIVLLGGRLFFRPKSLLTYFGILITSSFALACLVFIWGGLVPPRLAGVHITPSVKSPIVALLIFSLYFLFHNIKNFNDSPINFKRLIFSTILGLAIVLIGINQAPLFGGGYIFSRIESLNFWFAIIFETVLLILFFYKTNINVIVFFLLAALSFATTNYMFLKYVDFYYFAFLAYGMSDIDENNARMFANYAQSGFVFQLFSITLAIFYYNY